MKQLYLVIMLILSTAICFAQTATPTPTETPTSTPTNTPTPVVRDNPYSGKVTVGTGTTTVANSASCSKATEIIIGNDSNERMYLNVHGEEAVLNEGVFLDPGQSITWLKINHPYTWPLAGIQAICTSGGKNMCVSFR